MQNRYFGDVGDFGKYSLLRRLSGQLDGLTRLSLGVVWYLVPDEGHNDDGKHVSYLEKREYRDCDPVLYDFLNARIKSGSRAVKEIHNTELFHDSTVFFDDFLTYDCLQKTGVDARASRIEYRKNWLQSALNKTKKSDLIFLDPDNGFEVKSVQRHANKSPKYVFWDEVKQFHVREQSLVIYHHLNRTSKAPAQIQTKLQEFANYLGSDALVTPVLFKRGSLRVFFVVSAPKHQDIISRRLDSIQLGSWSSHLEVL